MALLVAEEIIGWGLNRANGMAQILDRFDHPTRDTSKESENHSSSTFFKLGEDVCSELHYYFARLKLVLSVTWFPK